MIRRHILSALALVALAAVVAAPAQAGGTSGAVGVKKTANVKIKNVGSTNTYVVIIPQGFAAPRPACSPGTRGRGWASCSATRT